MNIVLFGPPGAGKGTQANCLVKDYNLFKISTGDLLREEINKKTKLGTQISSSISEGSFVKDDIIDNLIENIVSNSANQNRMIFDGYPRTINQANALKIEGISINYCDEVKVPDDDIVERMSGRRVHLSSGRTYHIKFNPPKEANKDDITGGELIQRVDDSEEIVRGRLKIYHKQTEPLVKYYQADSDNPEIGTKFIAIDGVGTLEEVKDRISTALSS